MSGKLVLIPTPIAPGLPLEPVALELLQNNALDENVILLVEELKVARRMWSRFGLPREAFEKFIEFNEHTQEQVAPGIVQKISKGNDVYLLSDCGLPAFCDPGQQLVEMCHAQKLQVTATPFPNSIALSIALSGMPANEFYFAGFVSNKSDQRSKDIKRIAGIKTVTVIMDTPYRFNKLLEELNEVCPERELFVGANLNAADEICRRARVKDLAREFEKMKCEFVMVLGAL